MDLDLFSYFIGVATPLAVMAMVALARSWRREHRRSRELENLWSKDT